MHLSSDPDSSLLEIYSKDTVEKYERYILKTIDYYAIGNNNGNILNVYCNWGQLKKPRTYTMEYCASTKKMKDISVNCYEVIFQDTVSEKNSIEKSTYSILLFIFEYL